MTVALSGDGLRTLLTSPASFRASRFSFRMTGDTNRTRQQSRGNWRDSDVSESALPVTWSTFRTTWHRGCRLSMRRDGNCWDSEKYDSLV